MATCEHGTYLAHYCLKCAKSSAIRGVANVGVVDTPSMFQQAGRDESAARIAELEEALRVVYDDWKKVSPYADCPLCKADLEKHPHMDNCLVSALKK